MAQLAVFAAAPCNFLHTFLVESIFRIDPNVDVAAARSAGSLDHTSRMYAARNHLQYYYSITMIYSKVDSHLAVGKEGKGEASSYSESGWLKDRRVS